MTNNMYVASDGKVYEMSEVNTERLINSLAKHHREIYASESSEQFDFHNTQIVKIEEELLRRNKEFYNQKIGGGLW